MGLFRFAMRIASPTICRDPRFPIMMDRDLSSTTLESFLISIATLRKTDLRPKLHEVRVPVMGIYGQQDNIVNPKQYCILQKEIPSSRIELFEKSAHFVMLDEHQRFLAVLKDFLDAPN